MEYVQLRLEYDGSDVPPVVSITALAPAVGIGYQRRGTDMNFNVEEGWEETFVEDLDTRFPDNVAPA